MPKPALVAMLQTELEMSGRYQVEHPQGPHGTFRHLHDSSRRLLSLKVRDAFKAVAMGLLERHVTSSLIGDSVNYNVSLILA